MKLISFFLSYRVRILKAKKKMKTARKTEVECVNKFVLYDEAECCVFKFLPNVEDLYHLVFGTEKSFKWVKESFHNLQISAIFLYIFQDSQRFFRVNTKKQCFTFHFLSFHHGCFQLVIQMYKDLFVTKHAE